MLNPDLSSKRGWEDGAGRVERGRGEGAREEGVGRRGGGLDGSRLVQFCRMLKIPEN